MTIRADRRGLIRRAVLDRDASPDSLVRYYVYQLPDPALWNGAQVFVLDEVSGAATCFSDGVNWRRVTDLAIASAVLPTRLSANASATATGDGVAGPYLVAPGAATGIFVSAAFAASALSAIGTGAGSLGAPITVSAAISAGGAATVTGVGAFGTGEHARMILSGASVAVLGTITLGSPSALSATGRKCVALLTGATA